MKNFHRPELTEPTKSSSDRKKLLTPLKVNRNCCIYDAGNCSYALIVFKGIYFLQNNEGTLTRWLWEKPSSTI